LADATTGCRRGVAKVNASAKGADENQYEKIEAVLQEHIKSKS